MHLRDSIFWSISIICLIMFVNYQNIAKAEIAPIRTWGDLSTIYRERDFNNGMSPSTDWLTVSTINASSYIWHPWFALINGSLSFASNEEASNDAVTSRDEFINGKFQLNLFPTSRFPFTFYANKNKNELDAKLFNRTITNTLIGMRQQYRSLDGKQFYSANLERNKRDDIDQTSFVNDALGFTAGYQLQENKLSGDINYDNTSNSNEDDTTNYALTGRHSYTGKKNLTLENLLSTTQTHSDFINASTDITNNQFSSFLSWQPASRSDLNITGNIRVSNLRQLSEQKNPVLPGNTITRTEQPALNFNQGLIYNFTPRITITESINASQIENNNIGQFSMSESAGISYNSDLVKTVTGYYSWNAGSNINRVHGKFIPTEKTLQLRLGHSLSKDLFLTPAIKIKSNFNQSLGNKVSSIGEDAESLNHSLSLAWSESSTSNSSFVRFLASDVRNYDVAKNKFQLLNLQITNDYRFSRHSHLLVNMTLQKSRVTTSQGVTNSQHGSGQINFVKNRFLNTPELSFKSKLKFSRKKSDNPNDFVISDDSVIDNSWENELIYRIGLFEARLNLAYINNDDEYDRLIKIQLTRRFGDL